MQERQESWNIFDWNIFGGVLDGVVAIGATRDKESLRFGLPVTKARCVVRFVHGKQRIQNGIARPARSAY
jgi:hypothetical protein